MTEFTTLLPRTPSPEAVELLYALSAALARYHNDDGQSFATLWQAANMLCAPNAIFSCKHDPSDFIDHVTTCKVCYPKPQLRVVVNNGPSVLEVPF